MLLFKKKQKIDNELYNAHFLEKIKVQAEDIATYGKHGEKILSEKEILKRKKLFLEGVLELLRKDLFCDYVLSDMQYYDSNNRKVKSVNIFDFKLPVLKCAYKEKYNVKNKCIFVSYRKPFSLADELAIIDSGIPLEPKKYLIYKNMGIGEIYGDGNHRIIAAAIKNQNYIARVNVIDDSPLFTTFRTKDEKWFAGDKYVGKVFDKRISLIFEICRIIYDL